MIAAALVAPVAVAAPVPVPLGQAGSPGIPVVAAYPSGFALVAFHSADAKINVRVGFPTLRSYGVNVVRSRGHWARPETVRDGFRPRSTRTAGGTVVGWERLSLAPRRFDVVTPRGVFERARIPALNAPRREVETYPDTPPIALPGGAFWRTVGATQWVLRRGAARWVQWAPSVEDPLDPTSTPAITYGPSGEGLLMHRSPPWIDGGPGVRVSVAAAGRPFSEWHWAPTGDGDWIAMLRGGDRLLFVGPHGTPPEAVSWRPGDEATRQPIAGLEGLTGRPVLVRLSDGRAAMMWTRFGTPGTWVSVERSIGGPWNAPVAVRVPGRSPWSYEGSFAALPGGRVAGVWVSDRRIYVAAVSTKGRVVVHGAVRASAHLRNCRSPALSADGTGALVAFACFSRPDGSATSKPFIYATALSDKDIGAR